MKRILIGYLLTVAMVLTGAWQVAFAAEAVQPADSVSAPGQSAVQADATASKAASQSAKVAASRGVATAPAEKYDLVLWNHGGGPIGGFAIDEHTPKPEDDDSPEVSMPFGDIVDALAHNEVTKNGGKFDFVDFDACLMNSVDLNIVLSDYMDYYVASAETEPGFGQDYEGWLNMVGETPDVDTFALGKKIVDDYVAFYSKAEGDGAGGKGTLAVVDMAKLMDPQEGFVQALKSLSGVLKSQVDPAQGESLFYDELKSLQGSIPYSTDGAFDLGNLVSLLSVANAEPCRDPDWNNDYTESAKAISRILEDPEIIYARATDNVVSKDQVRRLSSGETELADLTSSGMYIIFPGPQVPSVVVAYDEAIQGVLPMLDENDPRREFLAGYTRDVLKYAFLSVTSGTVNELTKDVAVLSTVDISHYAATISGGPFVKQPGMACLHGVK